MNDKMDNAVLEDYLNRGSVLMNQDKFEAARDLFEEGLREDPRYIPLLLRLGDAQLLLEREDLALEAYNKVLLQENNHPEALYSAGSVHLLKGDYAECLSLYAKAEDAGYDSPVMYRTLAAIYSHLEDYTQALRNITRAIRQDPLDTSLHLERVNILLAMGRYEDALAAGDEMLAKNPAAIDSYHVLVSLYSQTQRYQDAMDVVNLGLERFTEDPVLGLMKAGVLIDMQKLEEAEAQLTALCGNPAYDIVRRESLVKQAAILQARGQNEHAAKLLEEALTLEQVETTNADILFGLLMIHASNQDWERLLNVSERLSAVSDAKNMYTVSGAFYGIAARRELDSAYDAKAAFSAMARDLRKTTILNPGFYEGYLYRAMCHKEAGEHDKAHELADYIINLYPDQADGHMLKQQIYLAQGMTQEAESELSKARSLRPDLPL